MPQGTFAFTYRIYRNTPTHTQESSFYGMAQLLLIEADILRRAIHLNSRAFATSSACLCMFVSEDNQLFDDNGKALPARPLYKMAYDSKT
ncbi:unnamed protein product [Ceratitis capitata]|uniref:(Mediterranean fruit fly) hypothetical protein n=1 Tax=Ceratitis capitata TaxID=7213 RepID=A0A811U6X4_CERCA|nr:unnamed protein product [Ceratitis capitata]